MLPQAQCRLSDRAAYFSRRPVSAIQFDRKLETDEQIAAWIQERKKKWPTAERAAEKVRLC